MGKKKNKKKSSSKSKKVTNTSTNNTTNEPIASTTDIVDVETGAPPSNTVSEEETSGSNEIVPGNSVEEAASEQGEKVETDVVVELETEDDSPAETSETELPTSKKVEFPEEDDDCVGRDIPSVEDATGDSTKEQVPLVSEPLEADDGAAASDTNENNNEAIVDDQLESNGNISDDDDDALFVDARSFETNDSIDDIASVEFNGEVVVGMDSEANPELDAEKVVEPTKDNDETNESEQQEEPNDLNKADVPAESSEQMNLDGEPESIAETKVEVLQIYQTNTDDEAALSFDDTYVKYDEGSEADNYSDDGTQTTYIDELPLFHYSRIVSSGLPRGIPKNPKATSRPPRAKHSKCSEFAVVRVDREGLVSSVSNIPTTTSDFNDLSRTASANSNGLSTASVSSAAAMRKRQREQALLLSSDLWFQPHSIVASGYGSGKITLTRLTEGQSSGGSESSPSVVFATTSTELGGIIDTSGHGKSNNHQSYTTVLNLREGDTVASNESSIVDMSFDASGSILGAIDGGGNCSIWEFKYTTSLQSTSLLFGDFLSTEPTANSDGFFTPASTPNPARPQVATPAPATGGMFSNFMSVLTGIPPADENNNSSHGGANINNITASGSNDTTDSSPGGATINNNSNNQSGQPTQPEALIPALTAEITQQTRNNYPAKWGAPTCLAIDPGYRIKRDKSIVVGFANGQLYLTKKGTFFQRRNDTILYQAGNTGGDSYRGIECVVWRGPLVAFADATGIKLIDSEHLTRIAHINRPAGASPFLYPSIRDVSPCLVFETSQHLLVGWGDCLMQIYVEEHEEDASSSTPSLAQSAGGSEASKDIRIRRTATCTMAWELDCVACDVVPLDSDNVVVLGLVSLTEDGEDINHTRSPSHDLEMQILSRRDGTISYSDSLPLIEAKRGAIESMLSVRDFRLLSSFALPRMTNIDETKALRSLKGANDMGFVGIDVSFDMNQPLFAGTDSFAKKGIEFMDPHLGWNIKSIMYDEDVDDETNLFGTPIGDDSSVDSDDYECILRPIETIRPLPSQSTDPAAKSTLPPTMVVCTPSEAILSLTSTVDDAIEYSLENHKCAMALSRGIRHRRQLRRYKLDDLISFYLEAVLRIPRSTKNQDNDTNTQQNISLSLRRMQLAIKAMPVLLGDRIELWERWTRELESIPGSLFLLRKYLPVRGTSQ